VKTLRPIAALLLAGLVAGVVQMAAPQATAAAGAGPAAARTPSTVTADALPTWQINGVVWDTVTVGDTVYATGNFTKARPPGTASGDPAEVDRKNLLAFNLTTGVVTSFAHTLNKPGRRIVASPDGTRIYVGGEFTTVDGKRRSVAAFDVATGDLVSRFAPVTHGRVLAVAATASTVYLGGEFVTVNTVKRTRLAAVSARTGALTRWKPTADYAVHALLVSDSRVIAGGRFQKLNGKAKVGVGALSAATGTSATWTSRPIPSRRGGNYSMVTDLVLSAGVVYGTADGEGHHWFDGRFAAKASNGALVWLDNCYGATYSAFVSGSVLYTVGHAHDCSSLGAFGETRPYTYHRALAETTGANRHDRTPGAVGAHYSHPPTPSLLNWFPTLNAGTFTGQLQAAWAVTGNRSYVALAGEFTTVNGQAQQGLTRFAVRSIAPDATGPASSSTLTPSLTSTSAGVKVTWTRTWDRDDANLTYTVLRDGDAIATITTRSVFWSLTSLSYTDPDALSGTYRIRVSDPSGNTVLSGSASLG
jgi:hypothetical protein